jgi:perosamine synthetase
MAYIPYGKQCIDDDDINEVVKTLKSGWLTQGPKIKEFEESICKYTGAKYAVAVANGTAALHLACLAAELGTGDELITSPISFVASSNCALYCGATPVFADIDPKTYNIDPKEIKKKITSKTKIIVPVHFAGQPCELEKINKIAKDNNLIVIEDACHAIGSIHKGRKIGACDYSDMTVFSFHPVKTIATGEGGMITTNNEKLYKKLILLRQHGINKDPKELSKNEGPWYYEMQILGYNYRISDILAALGITQMRKIDKFVKRRQEIVRKYNQAFADISWVKTPYEETENLSTFHIYVLQIDFDKINKSRSQVMTELKENNIGTQVHYIPIYRNPYYEKKFGFNYNDYPEAENYYQKALSIPLYPLMTNEEVSFVIDKIKNLCN